MTLGIAGTVCDSKITIENAEVVNKSYPHFFMDLESLGAIVKYI
jgi:5-enolpyruvylshikimate-3-phosphate synthase